MPTPANPGGTSIGADERLEVIRVKNRKGESKTEGEGRQGEERRETDWNN